MPRPIQIKSAKRTKKSKFKVLVHSRLSKKNYVAYADSRAQAKSIRKQIQKDFKVKVRSVKR